MKELMCDVVDLLMPGLTPYESSLYILLLRMSLLESDSSQIRIGKRTVAGKLGTSSRGAAVISFAQVTDVVIGLETKGCIVVGDTSRDGTLYTIIKPREVPFVKERLASSGSVEGEDDYFTDPDKRLLLFERDNWSCQYCGDKVTKDNMTLDHYIPQCKGGSHSKDNLRTSCIVCNSIKSGKTFDEAAPLILKSIQERKQRSHKSARSNQ